LGFSRSAANPSPNARQRAGTVPGRVSGLGWGVLPEGQIADDLAAGRLVCLDTANTVAVPLYWQRWRFASATLDRLTGIVRAAARSGLAGSTR
jgi:DNA-binding transcriptional LysR family regulator